MLVREGGGGGGGGGGGRPSDAPKPRGVDPLNHPVL